MFFVFFLFSCSISVELLQFTTMFPLGLFRQWISDPHLPTTPLKPNAFLFYHSEFWAFGCKSSCSFVLLPRCTSAEAAPGFISRSDAPFSTLTVRLLLPFFTIICVPALSSLPLFLHIALALDHVCLFPLLEPNFFFAFLFQLHWHCFIFPRCLLNRERTPKYDQLFKCESANKESMAKENVYVTLGDRWSLKRFKKN